MVNFITITPTKYMKDAFQISSTTLVLAHLIEEGNEYQRACKKFKRQGGEIWLDNSFYELRKDVKLRWLVEKAKLVNADLLVFPDVGIRPNLSFIISHGIKKIRELGFEGRIMVTVYGDNSDFKEDLKQFEILHSMREIDVLAITYVFRRGDAIRRPKFLKMIDEKLNVTKPVHLFGVNSFKNLKKELSYNWIKSVDSTLPWKLGYYNISLPIKDNQDVSRPKNYFDIDKLNDKQRETIDFNLKYLKEMLENGR